MYTYLILSEYIEHSFIKNIFDKRKNWKSIDKNLINENHIINFIYLDGHFIYNKNYNFTYNLKCDVKNQFDTNSILNIIDKNNLYKIMTKTYGQNNYMMPQIELPQNYPLLLKLKILFNNHKLWIIKPTNSFKGHGIKIVHTFNQLIQYMNKTKYDKHVLAEYIHNPLLIDNKKFHIRLLFMTTFDKIKNQYFYYLFKDSYMIFAKNNYQNNKYYNKNIHNTHFNKTLNNKKPFPKYFTQTFDSQKTTLVLNQIYDLLYKLKPLIKPTCYPEIQHICFNILGIDIMITNDFQIKLLEINQKIGLSGVDTKQYFNNIMNIVIDPTFPPQQSIHTNQNYFII